MNELLEEHIKLYKEVFMTPLISVIVPVFNVQRFLPKCIESILKQSYKNLEVFLIDDGSTDKSLEICKEYEQKDERIVVISQKNGGVSSARNQGLKIAKGEYICFVDSDDWIPKKSIQVLYEAISKEDADLAGGAFKTINPIRMPGTILNPDAVIDIENDGRGFLKYISQMPRTPWGKLYKKEIINKGSLQFPTGIAFGEDTIFLCNYLQNCKTICLVGNIVYSYNHMNGSSATHKSYSEYSAWSVLIVESFDRLCKRVDSQMANETVSDIAKGFLFRAVGRCIGCNSDRTESINSIRCVYDNLKQYIIKKENVECAALNEETLPYYLSEEGGAEMVYEELKKKESSRKRKILTAIKNFIRRTMRPIKFFWYFDLKL